MEDSTRFSYIVGRVRALETQMLNQTLVERMIDAKNADEAFRVLNDHPLISGHIGNYTVQDYQKVLMASLKNIKQLLHRMFPYKEFIGFLWYKYDFHNLKVVLKAKLTNHGFADIEHALVDVGLYSVSNWEKVLFEGKSFAFITSAALAASKATELYEKTKDPQVIDMVVDQHYLNELRNLAEEMESPLAKGYVSRLIDITNVRTFIRCKELKKDRSHFEKVFVNGGFVFREFFFSAYDKGYSELQAILEGHPHLSSLTEALTNVKKERSLFMFEIKFIENLQYFINESKLISFGPEPIFAFFYKFENHLQIIRTILVGKMNKLKADEIAASLPTL